jgi:nucleotide-binding universal stress UspA family protein
VVLLRPSNHARVDLSQSLQSKSAVANEQPHYEEDAVAHPIAYMPLSTYPEAVSDETVKAAASYASSLGVSLHVSAFTVDIPEVRSPFGGLLLDVPGMTRSAEERSRTEGLRLEKAARSAGSKASTEADQRRVILGAALDAAAHEARYYDLSVLPWSGESWTTQEDMNQAVVFGSGRPCIMVPPSARAEALNHLAIAWDGSRVASRALWDALALLPDGGRVSVLTIQDEKPLNEKSIARTLAAMLAKRGLKTEAIDASLNNRTVGEVLQDTALEAGASLLAMGGFGHSRVRDFILGGATKGVFSNLRLPVLLSH